MESRIPSIHPRPTESHNINQRNEEHGVTKLMQDGFKSVKSTVETKHPLEFSEQMWQSNQQQMDFAMLKNSQGIHAPIRLQMETTTAAKIQRLPGLNSSNLMADCLSGRIDSIEFEDVMNVGDAETMGQPHAMMERQLGFL